MADLDTPECTGKEAAGACLPPMDGRAVLSSHLAAATDGGETELRSTAPGAGSSCSTSPRVVSDTLHQHHPNLDLLQYTPYPAGCNGDSEDIRGTLQEVPSREAVRLHTTAAPAPSARLDGDAGRPSAHGMSSALGPPSSAGLAQPGADSYWSCGSEGSNQPAAAGLVAATGSHVGGVGRPSAVQREPEMLQPPSDSPVDLQGMLEEVPSTDAMWLSTTAAHSAGMSDPNNDRGLPKVSGELPQPLLPLDSGLATTTGRHVGGSVSPPATVQRAQEMLQPPKDGSVDLQGRLEAVPSIDATCLSTTTGPSTDLQCDLDPSGHDRPAATGRPGPARTAEPSTDSGMAGGSGGTVHPAPGPRAATTSRVGIGGSPVAAQGATEVLQLPRDGSADLQGMLQAVPSTEAMRLSTATALSAGHGDETIKSSGYDVPAATRLCSLAGLTQDGTDSGVAGGSRGLLHPLLPPAAVPGDPEMLQTPEEFSVDLQGMLQAVPSSETACLNTTATPAPSAALTDDLRLSAQDGRAAAELAGPAGMAQPSTDSGLSGGSQPFRAPAPGLQAMTGGHVDGVSSPAGVQRAPELEPPSHGSIDLQGAMQAVFSSEATWSAGSDGITICSSGQDEPTATAPSGSAGLAQPTTETSAPPHSVSGMQRTAGMSIDDLSPCTAESMGLDGILSGEESADRCRLLSHTSTVPDPMHGKTPASTADPPARDPDGPSPTPRAVPESPLETTSIQTTEATEESEADAQLDSYPVAVGAAGQTVLLEEDGSQGQGTGWHVPAACSSSAAMPAEHSVTSESQLGVPGGAVNPTENSSDRDEEVFETVDLDDQRPTMADPGDSLTAPQPLPVASGGTAAVGVAGATTSAPYSVPATAPRDLEVLCGQASIAPVATALPAASESTSDSQPLSATTALDAIVDSTEAPARAEMTCGDFLSIPSAMPPALATFETEAESMEPSDLSLTWDGSFGDMIREEEEEEEETDAEAGPVAGAPAGAWRRRSVADGYAGQVVERRAMTETTLKERLAGLRRRTAESVAQKARRDGSGDVTADDVMEGGDSMMQQLLWVMERLQDELVEEEDIKRQAMSISSQYKNSVELLERRVPQLREELEQCNVRLIELSKQLDDCVASRSQKDGVIASTDVAIMQLHEQMDKVEARRLSEGQGAANASPLMDNRTVEDAEKDFRQLKVRFFELSELRTRNSEKALRASAASPTGSPSFRRLPLSIPEPLPEDIISLDPPSTPAPVLRGVPSPTNARRVVSAPEDEETVGAGGPKSNWIGKFGRGLANRLWSSNPSSKESSPKAAEGAPGEAPTLPPVPTG